MPLSGTPKQRQYPADFFTGGNLAYLVGMSSYRFVPPLDSPKNDCLGLEQVLQEKHGFTTTTLFNTERKGVLELLEHIKQECKADSRVIFYYAGHGIADGADDENERPKGFLLAVDSERGKEDTYIEMGHVLEVLVGLPCSHLLIILDCCYAGAIRYAEQTRSIGSSVPKTLYAEKFTYYTSNPAKQVITSAACDQKAMDALGSRGALNANKRSPFAESLIRNLERGDQDWNFGHIQPDGIVTASELGYFLSMEVSDSLSKNKVPFTEQQTPSVFRVGDHTKGEFIFVSSQKAILQLRANPQENPWKGLADYSLNDNHLFYGRQRVLDGWWEGKTQYKGLMQLVSPEENVHKILVTGRSGSGKSSLVKAGVLARMQDESPGSVTIITPGNTPFDTHRDLLEELKGKKGKVYLMVDQYEELVTVCSDPIQQKDFENSLADIATLPDAKVIITLRSDLELRFVDSPFLNGGQGGDIYRFVVPQFSREEIREVVTQPAIQQLLEFRGNYSAGNDKSQDQADERFVNRIIDETFANPDSLPLLSFALNRLFEIKDPSPGSLLMETGYDDFGGISGILDKKLTDAYDAYDPQHQALFQQLICRMISFDAGYMAKKRVYTSYISDGKILNELEFIDSATMTAMNTIQQDLVKQRLLKTSRENEAGGTKDDNVYFEPAHEALLRSSNLISQWQNEGGGAFQGRIILLNTVFAAAKNYYLYGGNGKKGSLWKDDPRLDQVKHMWDNREFYPNQIEEAFIIDSLRARTRAKRILWTVVIVVFLLLTVASVITYIQKQRADDNASKAQSELLQSYRNNSQEALNNNDGLKSILLLAEAVTANRDSKTNSLLQSKAGHYFPSAVLSGIMDVGGNVKMLKLSADDKLLVVQYDSSTAVWNIQNRQKIFSVNGSADNKHLKLTGNRLYRQQGQTIECWDIVRKKLIYHLISADESPKAWSPTYSTFLQEEPVDQIVLCDSNFNLSNWALPAQESHISENGKIIVTVPSLSHNTAIPDSVKVWSVGAGRPKLIYQQKMPEGQHLAKLSPRGKYLVLYNAEAYASGSTFVIDIKTGKFYAVDGEEVKLIEFNPSETTMFFKFGSPGAARFVAIDLNTFSQVPGGWSQGAQSVYFFPPEAKSYGDSVIIDQAVYNSRTGSRGSSLNSTNGYQSRSIVDWPWQSIVTYQENGTLRIDSLHGPSKGLSFFTAPGADPNNVTIAASGKVFAASGRFVYIYSRYQPKEIAVVKDIKNCYFSDDGKYSLTLDSNDVAKFWEIEDNGNFQMKGQPITNPQLKASNDTYSTATVESDGRYVLYQSTDNTVYVLDFETGKCTVICKTPQTKKGPTSVAKFIKKDHLVIFSDSLRYVYSFDILNGKTEVICRLPDKAAQVIDFSSDEKFVMAHRSDYDEPKPGYIALEEFSLNKAADAIKGRLSENVLKKDLNNTISKYIGRDRYFFSYGNTVTIYNLKKDHQENLLKNFKPLKYVNAVTVASDTSKIFIFYDDVNCAVLDLNTGQVNASFRIISPDDQNYQRYVINKDENQLATFFHNKVSFIDVATGQGMTVNYNRGTFEFDAMFRTYINAVFNGYNLYYFNGVDTNVIGADIDLPPDLFQMQVIALTGARLNPVTKETEIVPVNELIKIRAAYRAAAAAHYKQCVYKKFNLWHQLQAVN